VALNFNFWGIGFSSGFCIPVMNCEGCLLSWFACPIGRMSEFIAFREFPILVLIVVLVTGLLMGRFLCGWVCPMGLVQDMLYKIPAPRIRLPRFLTWFKYGSLVITVIVVSFYFGKMVPAFFCQFCPTAALQVVIPDMIRFEDFTLDSGRILRFSVLAAFLVFAVLNHRSFCKVMCPIGAMVALTNKFTLFGIRLDNNKCVHCHKCDRTCPMNVAVEKTAETGKKIDRDPECIQCLTCEHVCPTAAISNNSRLLRKGPSDKPSSP
jgi:polyferredoxin